MEINGVNWIRDVCAGRAESFEIVEMMGICVFRVTFAVFARASRKFENWSAFVVVFGRNECCIWKM